MEPFWLAEAPPSPDSPHLDGPVDVAIVGAGITGCACALALVSAGRRVRIHEARTVASGASGRNGGFTLRGGAARYDVARETYGAETTHDFARRAILAALAPGPGDDLLEIGCGGGLLLRDVLATGARAVGLDHSPEMVALALETAPGADIVLGSAEDLPFPDASFSAIAMSIVFLFFDDPLAVLRECHRVLRPNGRLAAYTTAPELRGTPAAPEPVARHGHFYSDAELAALARDAAFDDVVAVTERGGQLLTARRTEGASAAGLASRSS